MERKCDAVYQVRMQVCNRIPELKDLTFHDKIEELCAKCMDKNVYVRKTAFGALQTVIKGSPYTVLDPTMFEQLIQKQEAAGAQEEVISVLKQSMDATRRIEELVRAQTSRLDQMQASELQEFLNLFLQLLVVQNPTAQAGFPRIIAWGLGLTSEQLKKYYLLFIMDFLMLVSKDEVSTSAMSRLMDLVQTIPFDQFNQLMLMLSRSADVNQQFVAMLSNPMLYKQLICLVGGQQQDVKVQVAACRLFYAI